MRFVRGDACGSGAQRGGERRRGRGRVAALEGGQAAERAPELRLHRAAVAREGVEGARAVAVADQGQAEPAGPAAGVESEMGVEQLDLHPIGPEHAPDREREPCDQDVLQGAFRHQLVP
jgi:hypothetical protein